MIVLNVCGFLDKDLGGSIAGSRLFYYLSAYLADYVYDYALAMGLMLYNTYVYRWSLVWNRASNSLHYFDI